MHHLNVNETSKLVGQKVRHFAPEKQAAIDEVQKLLQTGDIQEEKYPTWLANVVLVKKANGKWRICIYYTDLNKASPKDCFPLPQIDQLVDDTSGYEMLSFIDTFLGYNQIRMNVAD